MSKKTTFFYHPLTPLHQREAARGGGHEKWPQHAPCPERAGRAPPQDLSLPGLVPCWLCRGGRRTRQNNHFPASCTRTCTRVPTPVSCCSAMPYHTYTPLPPPPPPRPPRSTCVVAYAACARKMQNQDLNFYPPRTPLRYTPLSFAAGEWGGGKISNAMCVKNNYPMSKPVGRRSERV